MDDEDRRSSLKKFVALENRARQIFKDKLDSMADIEGYTDRMEKTASLWRSDPEVISLLEELRKVADVINSNFLEYKLNDMLLFFLHFISLHEEWFFRVHDGSHELRDLLNKPCGYSFSSTMSFVCNRWEQAMKGEEVYQNLDRIEMSCAYLLIFLSRLLYSPYIPENVKDIGLHQNRLDLTIGSFTMTQISISEISRQKHLLLRQVDLCANEIKNNTLSKEQWNSLVGLGLQNFANLITISDYLKNEVYIDNSDWRVLRPSFFEKSVSNWCTRVFPCRFYNGPSCSPEFPFDSIIPHHFEMYG